MPRHVRQKGRPNRSKKPTVRKKRHLNYKLMLLDIQTKATFETMTSSPKNERRHKNCLLESSKNLK